MPSLHSRRALDFKTSKLNLGSLHSLPSNQALHRYSQHQPTASNTPATFEARALPRRNQQNVIVGEEMANANWYIL